MTSQCMLVTKTMSFCRFRSLLTYMLLAKISRLLYSEGLLIKTELSFDTLAEDVERKKWKILNFNIGIFSVRYKFSVFLDYQDFDASNEMYDFSIELSSAGEELPMGFNTKI